MKKWIKNLLFVLIGIFLAAQFVRPARTNPVIDPAREYRAPTHVQQILDRSCNDCHSSRTTWPWYSNITPVSWWLVDHVKEARGELSFSELGGYSPKKAAHKFEEICGEIKNNHMPLREYRWLHRDAKLSNADRTALCEWSRQEHERILNVGRASARP